MNKPCARITLDLQQASTPTFVAVKKSDIGREIRITLSDGGFPYEISADCYAVLTGTKPDGNILYNHCDIEGNTIVYEITEQTTAAAGRMKAEVKLYGADDVLVTSATFRIIIDGTVYTDDKVESSSEFSALTQLMSQVLEIIKNNSGENGGGISITIVKELPTEDISTSTLYLVKDTDAQSNIYTEYLYVNGSWEIIGSQRLDLTGYATEKWVQEGYQPKGAAEAAVSQHNTDTGAHNDLRLELKALSDRLTAFFDSDDQTLDELSEIVTYIINNKSLIDSITTSKVNVADIVNNLTTNVSSKPLSAAQGVVLKGLIDTLSNSLSNYQPKGNYLTEVPDGYATESWVKNYLNGGSGNNDHVFYASNEPPDDMNMFLFDYSEIETNGRTISVGDWIVTPSGRVYVVDIAEDYGIDATYDASLSVDSSDPDNVDLGITGATVGQIAKIIAVDEKGRPTAWESVDLPDSGGNVDLTGYATEKWVKEGYQPKGDYLTDTQLKPVRETADKAIALATSQKIVETTLGEVIAMSDSSDMELAGLRIFGKTTQDGTPTPEAPVPLESVGESVKVTVYSKNLFALAEPGSVNASGQEITEANDLARRTPYIKCEPGEKYAFSKAIEFTVTNANGMLRCFDADKNFTKSIPALDYNVKSNIVTIPSGTAYFRFVQFGYGRYENVDLQIEKGDTVTEYEDVSGNSLTISTPNGLPGIPVASGGNYTDENGQQWICDEVDFGKGVYVQRVGRINSYNGESIGSVYLSSTGDLNAGATVLYPLSVPIETALSAEELAAYAALHTNYPNTTVYNDGGAGMEVKYVADTKLYVDKKFAELSAALLNQ